MRTTFLVLVAVLLVPGLALCMALVPYVHAMEITDADAIFGMARTCTDELRTGQSNFEICEVLNPFNLLGAGAILVGGLGVLLVLLAYLVAFTTGWSRILLAFSFPAASFFAIFFIAVITLGQALLAAGTLYLAESYFFGVVHPVVIGLVAIAGAIIAMGILSNLLSMFRKAETSVIGIAVPPVEAPYIHRLVMRIARSLNTKPPDHIVVGFDPTFFATSARVRTPFNDKALRGETLFLSLPLLRMLTKDEVTSILGHELAHFSGGDTLYSRRFAPAYRGLSDASRKLSHENDGANLWGIPASIALNFVLGVFSRAERRLGRARELRADDLGAEVGAPEALSSALIKMSMLAQIWQLEFDDMINRIRKGRFSRNLSRNFVERAKYDVDHDKIAGLAALSLEAEIEHPTDTHPITRIRVERLGVDPDALAEAETFKSNLFPETTIISKSDSIDRLEEALTDTYQQFIVHFAGTDDSDESKDQTAFSNLLSMWLAYMVAVDGDVDPREIEVAQSEAQGFHPEFDAVSFKEYCRHPEDIPPVEKLIYWANIFLSEEGAQALKTILISIAEADGEIHEFEAALIERLEDEMVGGLQP